MKIFNKHHIRKQSNPEYTWCGLRIEIIRCRPRYGFCNLQSGHQIHHDASAKIPDNMISLADDDDNDYDICDECLIESY